MITDRTQADVDRVKELSAKGWAGMTAQEKVEWNAGLKGAYNYTDLNRVETAVAELAADLCLDLQTKTDWTAWDIPKESDMDRYLKNIKKIRSAGVGYSTTPAPPDSMQKLDYIKANNIEKVLVDVYETKDALFRCGELYCGEV